MQLAHVASHEGIQAVEHIAGELSIPMHYANIARGVYSHPEVASVGLTEAASTKPWLSGENCNFPI